jgi:hypothetical protein
MVDEIYVDATAAAREPAKMSGQVHTTALADEESGSKRDAPEYGTAAPHRASAPARTARRPLHPGSVAAQGKVAP